MRVHIKTCTCTIAQVFAQAVVHSLLGWALHLCLLRIASIRIIYTICIWFDSWMSSDSTCIHALQCNCIFLT